MMRAGGARSPRRGWRSLVAIARHSGGVTAVESALLFPAFLMLLLGIGEFGRALWTQVALQYAVGTAARCAAVTPGSCSNVEAYAASQAWGLSIPSGDFTYTSGASCGISGYTGGAKVTVSYPFKPLVPKLVPLSVTLSARSCHP